MIPKQNENFMLYAVHGDSSYAGKHESSRNRSCLPILQIRFSADKGLLKIEIPHSRPANIQRFEHRLNKSGARFLGFVPFEELEANCTSQCFFE